MIQNVLSNIGGVGIYGILSICIFFAVFIAVVVWMLRLGKPYVNSMRALPLEDDSTPSNRDEPDNPQLPHD